MDFFFLLTFAAGLSGQQKKGLPGYTLQPFYPPSAD
jgi:hypothetical protein